MSPLEEFDPEDRAYWDKVRKAAEAQGTDGCTGVKDWFVECCWQHDIEWRGKTVDGEPLSRAECNARFRRCIQRRSVLHHVTVFGYNVGRLSPLSWARWAGVWLGTVQQKLGLGAKP